MAELDDALSRVRQRYASLSLPSWPDPHPGAESPRDEEYSRVTEPERYRIVHTRARGWAEELARLPGVVATSLAPAALDGAGRLGRFDRGVRLTCAAPGALPLLLLERAAPLSGDTAPLAVLHICVGRPEVAVATLPDCGCDACDQGSDALLDLIDEAIGQVVGGPFVVLRGDGWQAQWSPGSSRSSGNGKGPDHSRLVQWCRQLADGDDVRLPKGTIAYVGRPWLNGPRSRGRAAGTE